MTTTIIWTIAIISGLGLLLALTLYLVAQRFKVEEDPRIELVEKAMPGANCGGCGFAGCHAFADSAVKAPNLDNHFCPVGGNETMKKVAEILGYEIKEKAPMVAVVRCNGTCSNRPKINDYDGSLSCKVKAWPLASSEPFRWTLRRAFLSWTKASVLLAAPASRLAPRLSSSFARRVPVA